MPSNALVGQTGRIPPGTVGLASQIQRAPARRRGGDRAPNRPLLRIRRGLLRLGVTSLGPQPGNLARVDNRHDAQRQTAQHRAQDSPHQVAVRLVRRIADLRRRFATCFDRIRRNSCAGTDRGVHRQYRRRPLTTLWRRQGGGLVTSDIRCATERAFGAGTRISPRSGRRLGRCSRPRRGRPLFPRSRGPHGLRLPARPPSFAHDPDAPDHL